MKVYVDSVTQDLRYSDVLHTLEGLKQIELVASPDEAEAILITDDDAQNIRASAAWQRSPDRCMVINEGDILSYYIPALYSCNCRGVLSYQRALTIPFLTCIKEDARLRNAWISRLKHEPVAKDYLYSFMGGSTSWVRKRLLKQYRSHALPDVIFECTDHYRHWNLEGDQAARSQQQERYIRTMRASQFVICPRGASASSIRLFEAMELGCAPVVIADSWIPIEDVDWSFCLFVKEGQIAHLDAIIRSHESEWRERGEAAASTFEKHFAPPALGPTLERQMRALLKRRNGAREWIVRSVYPAVQLRSRLTSMARQHMRGLVLAAFRWLGRPFPYDLNR